MTTRQQQRARQHRQRRQPPRSTPAVEAMPVIARGREGLRIFGDACEAYTADMAAAFRACQDAIDEARDDCQRKIADAEAGYDRARAAAGALYEESTARSHAPRPDSEPQATE